MSLPFVGPVRSLLRRFDIDVSRYSERQQLEWVAGEGRKRPDLELLLSLDDEAAILALRNMPRSKSQSRQDIFALSEVGFKRDGFFVEFGAADGVHLSNSFLMETEFGWSGILAEPGRSWHQALAANRKATIEHDCVWSRTGETLQFVDVTGAGVLSTVSGYETIGMHERRRRQNSTYAVTTISLMDLLARHNAPREIDYLSIDTEGTELEILRAFNFNAYRFRVITVEKNDGPEVHDLLMANGYARKHQAVSGHDDWYVLA